VGLPIHSALVIADDSLRRHGVRDRVKLIASGKLLTPDRMAVALGMGADLVNVARGFMISVGCIGAQQCHTNRCPVGVATTDPRFQQALVVGEKKYRGQLRGGEPPWALHRRRGAWTPLSHGDSPRARGVSRRSGARAQPGRVAPVPDGVTDWVRSAIVSCSRSMKTL
jgi:hypothetical protein